MDTLPYQRAFDRIRAEYLVMPAMRLTPKQVERLCGVDRSVCRLVLDDLVRAKFLWVGPDGSYLRFTRTSSFGVRVKAHWTAGPLSRASRRAS
jgi:hypothetical protein